MHNSAKPLLALQLQLVCCRMDAQAGAAPHFSQHHALTFPDPNVPSFACVSKPWHPPYHSSWP